MDYEAFLSSIPKIKKMPLPAEASQFKMSPPFRLELLKKQKEAMKHAKQSAVLALFYPDEQGLTKFALILRKAYNGVHSAQISFPGGKVEDGDYDLKSTALRETHEEIGVGPEAVKIIKALTQVYIPPSNYKVQPYIGVSKATPTFKLEEKEVDDLLEVSLLDLFDESNIVNKTVSTSYKIDISVPAYIFNGHIVWGATAMMLSEVKDLLKESF